VKNPPSALKTYLKKITGNILWLYLLFLPIHDISAQDSTALRKQKLFDHDQIFSTFHWNFFVRPGVAFASPYHFSQPGLDFRLSPAPDLMVGWIGHINFNKNWAVQAGIGIEQTWIKFSYLNAKSFNTFRNDGTTYTYPSVFFLSVPIYAVYRLPLYDKHNSWLADFKLGVDLKYGGSLYEEVSSYNGSTNSSYNFIDFTYISKNTFHPSFHFSAGFQYILPNKKILEFSVMTNVDPFFSKSGQVSFGTGSLQEVNRNFSTTYSYLSFELNYVFTRVSHMKKARPGYTSEPNRGF
jgi:Outer membrane protein beta-barrel domain